MRNPIPTSGCFISKVEKSDPTRLELTVGCHTAVASDAQRTVSLFFFLLFIFDVNQLHWQPINCSINWIYVRNSFNFYFFLFARSVQMTIADRLVVRKCWQTRKRLSLDDVAMKWNVRSWLHLTAIVVMSKQVSLSFGLPVCLDQYADSQFVFYLCKIYYLINRKRS